MKINALKPAEGSRKQSFRKGRGHGSGSGKTAGRGHKGQNARSGGGVRIGFEGGQMPLYRRIPKRGFNNKVFAKKYAEVNVGQLNGFQSESVVTPEMLREMGIIKKKLDGVAILGKGELTQKLTVRATRFSKTATEKILAAGGKAEVV